MLKLVKLTKENYPLVCDMLDEWYASKEDIVPWAIARKDYHDFEEYSKSVEILDDPNLVPESTFFCLDEERNIIVGAINIRHRLNDFLLECGGHIGDGIRPSERNKGYGKQMIKLGLRYCQELCLFKVLMCCDKDNIASSKTIIANGGVLENEVDVKGKIVQRYWVNNNPVKYRSTRRGEDYRMLNESKKSSNSSKSDETI